MSEKKRTTKVKDRKENLTDKLNQVPFEKTDGLTVENTNDHLPNPVQLMDELDEKLKEQMEKDREYQEQIKEAKSQLFDRWESNEFAPNDFKIDIPVDSLESVAVAFA